MSLANESQNLKISFLQRASELLLPQAPSLAWYYFAASEEEKGSGLMTSAQASVCHMCMSIHSLGNTRFRVRPRRKRSRIRGKKKGTAENSRKELQRGSASISIQSSGVLSSTWSTRAETRDMCSRKDFFRHDRGVLNGGMSSGFYSPGGNKCKNGRRASRNPALVRICKICTHRSLDQCNPPYGELRQIGHTIKSQAFSSSDFPPERNALTLSTPVSNGNRTPTNCSSLNQSVLTKSAKRKRRLQSRSSLGKQLERNDKQDSPASNLLAFLSSV